MFHEVLFDYCKCSIIMGGIIENLLLLLAMKWSGSPQAACCNQLNATRCTPGHVASPVIASILQSSPAVIIFPSILFLFGTVQYFVFCVGT